MISSENNHALKYKVLKIGDYDYPAQFEMLLKRSAPPLIYYMGNVSLFNERIIMICGMRNASEKGLELAYKCGKLIAEQGYVVSSGYARGVDMAAHLGALDAGGDTIAFLPYGLSKFIVNPAIQGSFEPEHFLAASEQPPSYHFTVKGALRRNKLLAALSLAVVVIEPGETGGTWSSIRYANKMGKPLFFLEGDRPCIIPELTKMGAKRIVVRKGVPDLIKVYKAIGMI